MRQKQQPDSERAAGMGHRPKPYPPLGELDQALLRASQDGDIAHVKQLIGRGADVNAKSPVGGTPLANACFRCDADMAGLLLEKGADPDSRSRSGVTPLMAAIVNHNGDNEAVVRVLLEHKADPGLETYDGQTALSFAIREYNAGVQRLLREHGAAK